MLKKDPAYDYDAEWYMVAPSQIPPGEYPNAPMPKELEEHEIEEILQAYESSARRAIAAGLDGVEFHMSHGYLPWQFLSPLYNHREDGWGGSYEKRLRFPLEAMDRIRAAIGDEPFLGYRINSTSFWPGDLELEDVQRIVADFEARSDVDYVNLSAGVHHSFIHTPMTYEPGWERGYTKAVKDGLDEAGAARRPDHAPEDRRGHPRGRRRRRDPARPPAVRRRGVGREGARRARRGHPPLRRRQLLLAERDPRRPRAVRVQPGGRAARRAGARERSSRRKTGSARLVIGAGPAGLEYARVAAARGHEVVVLEREQEVGGHVRWQSLLPGRAEYGQIARWLEQQAPGNGADIRTGAEVTEGGLDALLAEERPDHVVVATGSAYRRDGWQGQTAAPIPGWESGRCVSWDEVVTGKAAPTGTVVVIDDLQDAAGPLTAVKLAQDGASVRLITRWPMIGMETIPEVYYLWVRQQLYEAGVSVEPDLFPTGIDGREVTFVNVYAPDRATKVEADWIVMVTGRRSENGLYHVLRRRGVDVEMVGDAIAPRTTYEAVFEGHRQARKL